MSVELLLRIVVGVMEVRRLRSKSVLRIPFRGAVWIAERAVRNGLVSGSFNAMLVNLS